MEVALASPRTLEELVQGLRGGLELTERMRVLVEAIREVVDSEEEKNLEPEATELKTLLQATLDDLDPVAKAMGVLITLDCAADLSIVVKATRRKLAAIVFRWLESALSSSAPGSVVLIEAAGGLSEGRIRIQWHAGSPLSVLSQSELGLLVAQAGWERAGGRWERERTEELETVTVRLTSALANNRNC